jgi:hypothetical protein
MGADLKTLLPDRLMPPQVLAHCLCQAP